MTAFHHIARLKLAVCGLLSCLGCKEPVQQQAEARTGIHFSDDKLVEKYLEWSADQGRIHRVTNAVGTNVVSMHNLHVWLNDDQARQFTNWLLLQGVEIHSAATQSVTSPK
jgi:hypothetical protein